MVVLFRVKYIAIKINYKFLSTYTFVEKMFFATFPRFTRNASSDK
jgi:hypothetical protein